MGEAMGSGFARLLSCEPALGVEGLGPWVCGGDSAPFFRTSPCGAGPKRCAAFEGPATQGPNRRLGLFVRHRNQQGKRSPSPKGRGQGKSSRRGGRREAVGWQGQERTIWLSRLRLFFLGLSVFDFVSKQSISCRFSHAGARRRV